MLVSSTFSFPHNVFKGLLSQVRKNLGLCGKELKNFSTSICPFVYILLNFFV